MSKQGDVLVSYNNQLVKCIEEMREKMDAVTKKITKLEEEKTKVTEYIEGSNDEIVEKLVHILKNEIKVI